MVRILSLFLSLSLSLFLSFSCTCAVCSYVCSLENVVFTVVVLLVVVLVLAAAAALYVYVQGAKAKTTKRASSMKDFIKHGCQEASVEIHFKNVGEDSFQPEIYGDTIVVHRYDDLDASPLSLLTVRVGSDDFLSMWNNYFH